MNKKYRYKLEEGSKKFHCPECQKKRFVRYVDAETNEYLTEMYGRCDRESKCAYHHSPYNQNYSNDSNTNYIHQSPTKQNKPLKSPKTTFIPVSVADKTLSGYEVNTFIQNLYFNIPYPFTEQCIEDVARLYYLGTIQNGYKKGATTFPFIDIKNNIRAIQVKQFDKTNHTTGTDFIHSIIEKYHTRNNKPIPEWLEAYNKNEKKVSCLFGEHLLNKYPHNPVALVEAPKTAIYGALYFGKPKTEKKIIWLAVYNLSSLNLDKCRALEGRNVVLFPDLSKDGSAFNLWKQKANELEGQIQGTTFKISSLLEDNATQEEKNKGLDLADYLIKFDWKLFN